MAYKEVETGIIFYVESDGRHIAAIDPEGKLLWVRDPSEERHLCYAANTSPPIIFYLGAPREVVPGGSMQNYLAKSFKRKTPFIEVEFDTADYGFIDTKNGDFFLEGRN